MFYALGFGTRVVIAITFQKVDNAPCAEAGTQSNNQDFQGINRTCKKSHKVPPLI